MSVRKETRTRMVEINSEVAVMRCDGPHCEQEIVAVSGDPALIPGSWYILQRSANGRVGDEILDGPWHFHSLLCLMQWSHTPE